MEHGSTGLSTLAGARARDVAAAADRCIVAGLARSSHACPRSEAAASRKLAELEWWAVRIIVAVGVHRIADVRIVRSIVSHLTIGILDSVRDVCTITMDPAGSTEHHEDDPLASR
jgi:hypothetical protein